MEPKPLVEPVEDRIVIRPDDPSTCEGASQTPPYILTANGMWIPNPKLREGRPQEGTVLAAGPGKYEGGVFVPLTVKAGDRVLYGMYSGTRFKLDDEAYIIMRPMDLLARLNRPAPEPPIALPNFVEYDEGEDLVTVREPNEGDHVPN